MPRLHEYKNENSELTSRLEELAKLQRSTLQAKKPAFDTLAPKRFRPQTARTEASSQLDFELIKQKLQQKAVILEKERERLQLDACTFKPQLNDHTVTIMQDQAYVPVYARPMPGKRVEAAPPAEELAPTSEAPKTGRRFDPHFYDKTLEWKHQKEGRKHQEWLERDALEFQKTSKGSVDVNRRRQLGAREEDFMERVRGDLNRSKDLKQRLDHKYNTYAFKPKVNRTKNVNVESVVYSTLVKNGTR